MHDGAKIAVHIPVASREKKKKKQDYVVENSHSPKKLVMVERMEGKQKLEIRTLDETTSGDSQSSRDKWTKET